ncbi:Heterokaryon incompatibility protein 6, OR allele [Colletotrichum sidae]|uniref:Heterokaryon incompatibility protein 6, OR allele n=1 Tax=Colletotrichum sidae TaxID=1347389 RepID=A0A4R8TJ01_9PEZI|nr:Heterokaryon incompatibility protein 6, OR allele [Colletotrichum sidae]
MAQSDAYQYQPLPPTLERGRSPPYTRLLYLSPGSGDEPFEASLDVVDVTKAPPYEALSYTWGPPSDAPRDYIWVQGCPLPIKPSLENALRALRLPSETRPLWIDALCIDQSNLDERARQVQYMRLVYKFAYRVVVWLGLKTPGTHEAFQAAERLARIRDRLDPANRRVNGGEPDPDMVQGLIASMTEDLPETSMIHLYEVFQREYFSRCWCVQEVVASSQATAKIEELEMSFFDLLSSLLILSRWKAEIALDRPWELWQKILMTRQPNNTIGNSETEGSIGSFLYLLELTRTLQATDSRDKIFALLGICDEGLNPVLALTQVTGGDVSWRLRLIRRGLKKVADFMSEHGTKEDFGRPMAMRPDYRKDAVLVYRDLTRFLIRRQPRVLDVLEHVSHIEQPGTGGYPSWVPKWFERRSCMVMKGAFFAGFWEGRPPYIADLRDSPMHGESLRPDVLSLGGYHVDVVSRTGEPFEFVSGYQNVMTAISRSFLELFEMPFIPRPRTRYRDGSPLDVAYCKALMAGFLGAAVGRSHLLTLQHGGFTPVFDRSVIKPLVSMEKDRSAEEMAEVFLGLLALIVESGGTRLEYGDGERDGKVQMFLAAAATYASNRRAFMTGDGRVGIGPRMMRPGDELVVLFGGHLPFIVRRRGDHHLLIGSCFVSDDELMWGKITDVVKRGRGGPPTVVYDFR